MFTVLISGLCAVSLRLNKSPFSHAVANTGKQEDRVSVWDERAYARMYVKNAKKLGSGEIEKKKPYTRSLLLYFCHDHVH